MEAVASTLKGTTELKELEGRLEHAKAALKDAKAARKDFIASRTSDTTRAALGELRRQDLINMTKQLADAPCYNFAPVLKPMKANLKNLKHKEIEAKAKEAVASEAERMQQGMVDDLSQRVE
eukprot:jgi/Tetstr1/427317/TSEL_017486.t1